MRSRLIESHSQRLFEANATTSAGVAVCLILIVIAAAFVTVVRAALESR